jgi:transposase
LSRPSFYQAQAALEREGLSGLLAKKRGPRRSHKLGTQVMGFVQELLSQEPTLSSSALAARVQQRFKLRVHSRSIERALVRQEKKRR